MRAMLIVAVLAPPAAAEVGMRPLEVPAAHRDAPLRGVTWYPADGPGVASSSGGNAVSKRARRS